MTSMSSGPDALAFDVVRLSARAALTDERRRALHEAVARGPAWDDVLRLGAVHRVLPQLDAHLGDVFPPEVAAVVHQEVRRQAFHVLFLASEMARIARSLEASGIPYLVMKGPSMAEAYGGTAQRPYVDNDVLIRREDFGAVERLLLETGFRERKRSDRQQAGYLRIQGEYTFGRSVGSSPSTVDAHTRLLPLGFAFDGPFDALVRRAQRVPVAGKDVPALGWSDLFLTLAVNALKDQWNRLRLATDFAEVAGMIDDWDGLLDRASREQCLRATRLAVLVSAAEVGAVYPAAVIAAAEGDRRAAFLARAVSERLRQSHERGVMRNRDRVVLNVLAPDGLRGQLRYAGYAALRRATEWYVDVRPDDPVVSAPRQREG